MLVVLLAVMAASPIHAYVQPCADDPSRWVAYVAVEAGASADLSNAGISECSGTAWLNEHEVRLAR